MTVLLALDVGEQSIGLAVSEDGGPPRALHTIWRRGRRRDLERLAEVATSCGATMLIVGLPRRSDGSEGDSARRARAIGQLAGEATGLPVVFSDEGLSTFEATERLRALGLTGEQIAERVDAEAARVILEDYLRRA